MFLKQGKFVSDSKSSLTELKIIKNNKTTRKKYQLSNNSIILNLLDLDEVNELKSDLNSRNTKISNSKTYNASTDNSSSKNLGRKRSSKVLSHDLSELLKKQIDLKIECNENFDISCSEMFPLLDSEESLNSENKKEKNQLELNSQPKTVNIEPEIRKSLDIKKSSYNSLKDATLDKWWGFLNGYNAQIAPFLNFSKYNFECNMFNDELKYVNERNAFFLKYNPDLNIFMRADLLHWLLELSSNLCFRRETFFLTVNIIDRFLSCVYEFSRKRLQLLGTASLMIAAKYEETSLPQAQNYSDYTLNRFSARQILNFELDILTGLKWKIARPTLATWVNFFTIEWDNYIDSLNTIYCEDKEIPKFRQKKSKSDDKTDGITNLSNISNNICLNINKIFFIFELISIDLYCVQLRDSHISSSVIYLYLLDQMNLLSYEVIVKELVVDTSSISSFYDFNNLFNDFITKVSTFDLNELLPIIKEVSKYFVIYKDIDYNEIEFPKGKNFTTEEDLCQIQVFNPNILNSFDVLYPKKG